MRVKKCPWDKRARKDIPADALDYYEITSDEHDIRMYPTNDKDGYYIFCICDAASNRDFHKTEQEAVEEWNDRRQGLLYSAEDIIYLLERIDIEVPIQQFFDSVGGVATSRQYKEAIIECLCEEVREILR